MEWSQLLTDAADLVLGHVCLGCGEPGPELCGSCLHRLRRPPLLLSGRPPVLAASRYDGLVRAAVLAYKEDGHRSLAAPLGRLLADAIGVAQSTWQVDPVVLVRVPGHRRPPRGFDALGAVLRHAADHLARGGLAPTLTPALRVRAEYRAAKGLDRRERGVALHGAFSVRRPIRVGRVLLVDDVATTGATLREAARALSASGLQVAGAAVICAVQPG